MIETENYSSKSKPGKIIPVPKRYSGEASKLIDAVLNSSVTSSPMNSFIPFAREVLDSEHPYLGNAGILDRVVMLINKGTQAGEELTLQDDLYLRVCIKGLEKNYSPEAENLCQSLIHEVECLYTKDKETSD
jgi:hypothetical protein